MYATSYGDNAIVVLDRSLTSGALKQKSGPAGCLVGELSRARGCRRAPVGIGPISDVAISPDGKHVYTEAIFDRAASGALTPRGRSRTIGPGGATKFSADGKHAYTASLQVYARNPADGSVTPRGCFLPKAEQGCMRAYGLNDAVDLALSPDGKNVYVGSMDREGDDVLAIFDRDPGSGKLTQGPLPAACVSNAAIGGCASGRLPTDPNPLYNSALSVAVSPDSRSVYVAGDTIAVFQRR